MWGFNDGCALPVNDCLSVLFPGGLGGLRAPEHLAQLSPAQRQWLASHGELRVGVVLQTPYAQYDRRLQRLSGVNVELMKWVAKSLKVELSWRNFPDLAQLEAAAREDEIDIAPGLTQTPGGLRLWQFSDPYMRVPQLVVSDQKSAGVVELENSIARPGWRCACLVRPLTTCAAITRI